MQAENPPPSKSHQWSGWAKAGVAVLVFYVLAISGGLGIARNAKVSLPPVVRDAIVSHTTTLGLAAALGVAGIFGLTVLGRRRKTGPVVVRSHPIIFVEQPDNVHPLFTSPRTVRDDSFVFKKTRKKGRIYRNRDGERFLLTDPDEHSQA